MPYRTTAKVNPILQFSDWAEGEGIDPARFSEEQKVAIGFARQFLDHVASEPVLRRMAVYFLAHCGAGYSDVVIGQVCARSRDSVSDSRSLSPREFVSSFRSWAFGKRGPKRKLSDEHVGIVAAFLAGNPYATHQEIADYLKERHGVDVGRWDALSNLLKRFGMTALKKTT